MARILKTLIKKFKHNMHLIGIEFDFDESQRRFCKDWPEGTDAYKSYFIRLTEGPNYNQEQVVRFDLAINKTH